MLSTMSIGEKLAALVVRAQLSRSEFARRAGYTSASAIERHFKDDSFISPKILNKFVLAMEGLGEPPIERREILVLGDPTLVEDLGSPAPKLSSEDVAELVNEVVVAMISEGMNVVAPYVGVIVADTINRAQLALAKNERLDHKAIANRSVGRHANA